MSRGSASLGAAVVTLALAVATASADENRIAIESHTGVRTAEIARAMSRLQGELERWRFTAEPAALKQQLGEHVVVAPGLADPRFTAQTFSKQVEAGLNAVVNEQYVLAVRILVAALDTASRNSLVLARDPKSRESRLEALIYLTRAYKHLGDAAARDGAMLEILRSYPDKVIAAKKYGPDAEQIYEAAKRSVDRGGRGRLSVEVTEPDAVIYVDEAVRGRGKVLIGDVIPGPHRVLVDGPDGVSRQLRVTVLAGQHTRLQVDWDVHSVLVTGDWVGLLFVNEQDREREGLLARKLAGAHTSAVMVAVISGGRVNHSLVVRGAVHAVGSGKILRRGQVELTGRGDAKKLEQLAAYLGFQEPGEDVAVIEQAARESGPLREPAQPAQPPAPLPRAPVIAPPPPLASLAMHRPAPASATATARPTHAWIGGTGVSVLVAGAVLIALDGTGTCGFLRPGRSCNERFETRTAGTATLLAGGALITAAGLLHPRHPRRRAPAIAAVPVRGGAIGSIGWSFR